MANYALNADVGNYLNVTLNTAGQALVDSLLAAFTTAIDSYCNRTWNNTNPVTETFDATRETFFVSQPPVTSVDSITIAGQAVDAQYINNYRTFIKIWVFPHMAWLFPLFNPRQAVSITYHTGNIIDNVPADVKQALVRWVAEEFQRAGDGGKDTTQVKTGQVQVWYDQTTYPMPKFVKLVLDNYRLAPIDRF